jgi:hypothetical protein
LKKIDIAAKKTSLKVFIKQIFAKSQEAKGSRVQRPKGPGFKEKKSNELFVQNSLRGAKFFIFSLHWNGLGVGVR